MLVKNATAKEFAACEEINEYKPPQSTTCLIDCEINESWQGLKILNWFLNKCTLPKSDIKINIPIVIINLKKINSFFL